MQVSNRLRSQLPSQDGWAVSSFTIPFCYVDDLVNGLRRLINEEASGSKADAVSAQPAYGFLNHMEFLCCPLSNPKPVSRNHLPLVELAASSIGHCQARE